MLPILFALASSLGPSEDVVELLRGDREALNRVVAMGESAVDELARILKDDEIDLATRFMAANTLGDIGSARGVDPLLDALADPAFNVRRCAALALGKIRDPRAKEPLEKLAKEDPFVYHDPESGKDLYLVRDDALRALELLAGRVPPDEMGLVKEAEIFLDDASKLPPSPVRVEVRRLPFPFPGGFEEQGVYNNYQQTTDAYVHAALDILQPPGTEVRAIDDGVASVVATNYPEWKTHHFLIVAAKGKTDEGWCYTHLDPDSYTFAVGDAVKKGQVLGKVVDFYVGKNKGADHLHLHYVRFAKKSDGSFDVTSLVDPLLFLDWKDALAPVIQDPIRFVKAQTSEEFAAVKDGIPVVAGDVDVVAGISDMAFEGQTCNWMVPVVTIEIRREGSAPWRKLVLDQRGEVAVPRAAPALYARPDDAKRWKEGAPSYPPIHVLLATHTDGDGVIESADALQAWRTGETLADGKRRFPDGVYEVVIRAWDLKGNRGERVAKVRVATK